MSPNKQILSPAKVLDATSIRCAAFGAKFGSWVYVERRTMTSHEESWKVTIKHLKAGRALLPQDMLFEEEKVFKKEYAEYLDHNELELAMNALDDLGLLCNAPNEFWHQLESAASNMGLTDKAVRFKQRQNT